MLFPETLAGAARIASGELIKFFIDILIPLSRVKTPPVAVFCFQNWFVGRLTKSETQGATPMVKISFHSLRKVYDNGFEINDEEFVVLLRLSI